MSDDGAFDERSQPVTTTTESTDVLVIGGGILGCVTAYHLAQAGVATMLVDSGELNREASGTNAGSLHFQIMRQPDYSKERLDHLRDSVEIHAEASRMWSTIESDLGCDLGVRLGGGLMIAETEDEFSALQEKCKVERDMGLESEIVTQRDIADRFPHLSSHLLGADFCPSEGYANPLLVAPAFARGAIAAGAEVRLQSEVLGIEVRPAGGFDVKFAAGTVRAERIVNAAGSNLGQLSAMVGYPIPVTAHAMQVHVTDVRPSVLPELIQHVGRRLTLKQSQYGTFIIGGGWPGRVNPANGRKETRYDSILGNLWVASKVLPALREAYVVRSWGGAIPITPGRFPVVGEVPNVPGYFVLHLSAGFTLGPVAGMQMAELVRTGRSSISLDAFRPAAPAAAAT
jgi:glycine/D-amino acid oxidase-like deaminating enzyme